MHAGSELRAMLLEMFDYHVEYGENAERKMLGHFRIRRNKRNAEKSLLDEKQRNVYVNACRIIEYAEACIVLSVHVIKFASHERNASSENALANATIDRIYRCARQYSHSQPIRELFTQLLLGTKLDVFQRRTTARIQLSGVKYEWFEIVASLTRLCRGHCALFIASIGR